MTARNVHLLGKPGRKLRVPSEVPTTRVFASATVEQISAGRPPLWEVEVQGGLSLSPEHLHRRTYQITANSDNVAANEGIRQFVEEIEALSEWK